MEAHKPTQQAFGSSGGKAHLAKKISGLMPEHTTYVEPYAGGGAVYFYKEPAKKEVLNDKDKEIAFAYRFIRDMTPEQYRALQRKDWVISRHRFDTVKAMKPATDVGRFYKFYYTKKGSFRHGTGNVNVGSIGTTIGIDRLPKARKRLRGVAVNSVDALAMIDRHDSPNTFFYLDPPYPSASPIRGKAPKFTKEDLGRLTDRLKRIRGKFILSMDTGNVKNLPSGFNIQRVATVKHGEMGGQTKRMEVLATNYPIRKTHRKRRKAYGIMLYDTPDGYRATVRRKMRYHR